LLDRRFGVVQVVGRDEVAAVIALRGMLVRGA
jgi:hypothetical protein